MKNYKSPFGLNWRKLLGLLAAEFMAAGVIQATPYATCLTNSAGVISFRLNEAADSVIVISSDGAVTNELGPIGKGLTITNLGLSGVFKVQVTKTSGAGWRQGVAQQISSDDNRAVQFEQPVGVAVNRNSASPYFGRVYVSNSRSLSTVSGRTATEGIYLLTPDLTDELGQGDAGLTGGITTFDTGTYDTTSPWRIQVGEDDKLYIADFNPTTGTLWVTDPNVSAGSAENVLDGMGSFAPQHGQIASSPILEGSTNAGNLAVYLQDADYPTINGVHRFDIGAGPLPSTTNFVDLTGPSAPLLQISRVIVGMDRAKDGKFYLTQFRADGNEGGLFVIDNQDADQDGYLDRIYSSLEDWRAITGDPATNDFMRHSYAVKISPIGNYLAIPTVDGPTFILPLDAKGLPVLTNRVTVTTAASGPTRDACFDVAGNLYIVNNNVERLRVFSPGGKWVATTGSDGTFKLEEPSVSTQDVLLSSSQTNMYERVSSQHGNFTLTRIGATTQPLTVNLAFSGTAVNGTDLQTLPGSITIPAGAVTASQEITPIDNNQFTGDKTLIVTITPGAGYTVVSSSAAVALRIVDDETDSGTVLFSDNFESDSSANWTIKFGSGNNIDDYSPEFAFDYSALGIPPAPHSGPGENKGLRLRVNKFDPTAGGAAAVNVYAAGKTFTGDFALRADVYMSIGTDASGTTEHTLFGINCSGTVVDRHGVSGTDGLWFAVDSDGSDNRGFGFYGTANSTAPTLLKQNSEFVWAFPSPPYGFAGAPGNWTNVPTQTGSGAIWADVEVRQVGGVITMKVNNTTIFQFDNTYAYTSGTVMLGHNDEFNSIGSLDTFSLWDNVRVVQLASQQSSIAVKDIQVNGSTVLIDFTSPTAGTFTVLTAATVNGVYQPDPAATVVSTGPNSYRATTSASDPMRFYRLSRAP